MNHPSKRKKSRKANFTDPIFIQDLHAKALSYYFGADQYKSSTKERFSKRITEDPIFKAIRYLRTRFHIKQRTQEFLSDFPNEHREQILGSDDPEPAKMLAETFIGFVRQGDIPQLGKIVKLCEIIEAKTFQQPRERQSDPLPWHYYAGIVTCQSLRKGEVPTKKQVKEAALRERAIVELPKWEPSWDSNWSNLQKQRGQRKPHAVTKRKPPSVKDLREKRIAAKVEELRALQPRRWPRVFIDLGLGDLPSAPTRPKKQAPKMEPEPLIRDNPSVPKELIAKLYRIAREHNTRPR